MWNLLVALIFVAEVRLGTLWREGLGVAAVNVALLLVLRYAFLGRQERRLMTLSSWAAWGWVLGAVWAALRVAPLWQGVLLALGLLLAFGLLTEGLGAAGWRRFVKWAPGDWQHPGPQLERAVLSGGPFYLQADPNSEQQWEVYTQAGHYAHTHTSREEAEKWVLGHYRAYREDQRLTPELLAAPAKVAPSGNAAQHSSRWTQPNLSAAEVLAHSPFVLVGHAPGGATLVRYEPDGTRDIVSFDQVDDPTLAGYPPTRLFSGFDLFVRNRGDYLGHFDDLAAAEAEILRRYAAQWPEVQQDDDLAPSDRLN